MTGSDDEKCDSGNDGEEGVTTRLTNKLGVTSEITTSAVTTGSGVPGSLLAGLLESCQILLAS